MNNNSYINIRLLDIVSISRESVKEFDGIKKYLSTGDLDFDKIVNLEDITWENKPSRANQLVKENDVLFAKMKDTKKTLIIDDAKKDLIVSTGFYVLTVSEKIMPKYLYYFLSSEIFLRDKNKLCKGATQKALNNEGLSKIKILLPNLNLQYKTIDILDKAKNLIDKRKLQLEYLDELVKSKFIEMFGDPAINPKGWEKGKIADIIIKTQYGTSNKANEENGQFKILRMGNITYNGQFDFNDMKYIDLTEDEQKKYLVYKGEVLFNRTNSKELVGKTAVYKENEPMAYAGYLVKAIPNERATGEFIAAYMNTKYVKSKLLNMAKNIVGMANINAEEFKKIDIYIPPIELQNEYIKFIEQVDKLKFEMEKSLKQLEDNFNSLMQRAFKGELFN